MKNTRNPSIPECFAGCLSTIKTFLLCYRVQKSVLCDQLGAVSPSARYVLP